jgi:AAA lid domain
MTATQLLARYSPDRRLPDSAVDLMDESAALLRLRLSTAVSSSTTTASTALPHLPSSSKMLPVNVPDSLMQRHWQVAASGRSSPVLQRQEVIGGAAAALQLDSSLAKSCPHCGTQVLPLASGALLASVSHVQGCYASACARIPTCR